MPTQERLSEVFVEMADSLVADFDVVEFLTTLAHRCVEVLDAHDAGVVLADETGTLRSIASSAETARMLDLFELQQQEGPCLDSYRTGAPIVNATLGEPDRWPVFGPEARRLGFRMVHALPMRLRGRTIGAVNVFAESTAVLEPPRIAVGQALADIATISLLQERGRREARVLNEQLQGALASRVIIEQAKGMLAERRGLDMDAAFEALRAHARRTNTKLAEVCSAVLAGDVTTEQIFPTT